MVRESHIAGRIDARVEGCKIWPESGPEGGTENDILVRQPICD